MADSPETAPLVETEYEAKETKVVVTDADEKPKDETKEDYNVEEKEEKKEEVVKQDDEKEPKYNISDNIVPKDYNPQPRASIADTAKVPAYDASRRLSKLEMDEMQKQINNMTEALISDPKEAVRRFTVDIKEEDEKKYDNKQEIRYKNMDENKSKSHFHTKKELSPLKPFHVCLGLAPLIFIVIVIIFGAIVYGIAQGADGPTTEPGPFGDWPNWGGNVENQQRSSTSMINSSNAGSISFQCVYESMPSDPLTSSGASGYIATDRLSMNGFFTDASGYVTSINLDTCELNWKTKISDAVKSEINLISRNGLSLYRDSNANKAVLIGSPNGKLSPKSNKCYILSLSQETGKKLFSISIEANGNAKYCMTDGFIIDGKYAYGGIYTSSDDILSTYRGEVIKIDLDQKQIVGKWYSMPSDTEYIGAPPINYPSIIDDYLVISTGPLSVNPQNVDDCLAGDFSKVTRTSLVTDSCGQNRSAYAPWRCLEDDINVDAINVLNKTSFETIKSIRLQGNDISTDLCNLWTGIADVSACPTMDVLGPGSGVSAQATYRQDDDVYAAVMTKGGMFYVFELPRMELTWAKKIGPSGLHGGGLYSLAIDPDSLIAILSISGLNNYRYSLSDGTNVCGTGFVEAINLKTGVTLWQFVNPFGMYGNACQDDDNMYNISDYAEMLGGESCRIEPTVTGVEDKTNVIIEDISGIRIIKNQENRANFIAPVTVSNDVVFIPSNTGDVFVLDIMDGNVLKHFGCKNTKDMITGEYNRDGISAGITVVKHRIVMYCGSGNYGVEETSGRRVTSYKVLN